jgi:fused signal recognition particle receptor
VFIGKENQDPAAVIFDACAQFKNERFDHIIIDTAGRLQTKVNLMKELEKICKIIGRQLPDEPVSTWIIIDAMLGQNSLRQAELFHEATALNGLVLTKLDGTGKGGIVFAIAEKLHVPITYVTFGEKLDDIKPFNVQEYVHDLLFE